MKSTGNTARATKSRTNDVLQIGLLRSINVGGHSKLPMAALRAVCEQLGFRNPATYIQSGNILFESDESSAEALAARLEQRLFEQHGVRTVAIFRTLDALRAAAAENPFEIEAKEAPNKLLVSFLRTKPDSAQLPDLQSFAPGGERIALRGRELFIYFPEGAGKSKLNMARIEKVLGSPSTARNWNTVQKLIALATERSSTV